MMDIKRISAKFEELEKEYDKTFDGVVITLEGLPAHRLQFIFAKLAEMLVTIDDIREELRMCKRII